MYVLLAMGPLRGIGSKLLNCSQTMRGMSSKAASGMHPTDNNNNNNNKNNSNNDNDALTSAVRDAEKVVGYSTSFMNLRWILDDKIALMTKYIPNLVNANHPLIGTAKNLLVGNDLPPWGLLMLLVSKAAGLNSEISEHEYDETSGVLHSQRVISEVTEMMRASHMIHKGLVKTSTEDENYADLTLGNKLASLIGNHLISMCLTETAKLGNSDIQGNISAALKELSESEFIGPRDNENRPLPSRPLLVQMDISVGSDIGAQPFDFREVVGTMKAEWTLRNTLGGASLLGRGCRSSMILANHDIFVQEMLYDFGRNLALAWQIRLETEWFLKGRFSLVAAPIMFHLEQDPGFYEEIRKGSENIDLVDRDLIMKTVQAGTALRRTAEVQNEFKEKIKEALGRFDDTEARKVLLDVVNFL